MRVLRSMVVMAFLFGGWLTTRELARRAIVPPHLAATAQALYALGAAATTALLTLASGRLYARLGAEGFLVMALLCAAAVPLTLGLRRRR